MSPLSASPGRKIKAALKNMKNGKAAGINMITTELLKADIETTACVLEDLFRTVWEEEEITEDWNYGLIVRLPKKGNLKGISLAAAPLADRGFAAHAHGLRPLFFSPRANPATNPASSRH